MGNYSLQVNNLTCIRGDRRLFTDLSFELQASQLLHLKGRNGTGKTTLQRSLAGLFHPDAGDVLWKGQAIKELGEIYYQDVLYLGHAPGIKLELSAAENLRTQCGLRGLPVAEDDAWFALQKLGLGGFEDIPARMLSAGQKRRIALARLFVDKARLWILDEPFTALDVAAVDLLQDIIAEHLGEGGMVVLTTHQEVELPDERVMKITLGEH
jgi:heme exporter protein A